MFDFNLKYLVDTLERHDMKFILHLDSSAFLVCDACGSSDFKLLPDRKLSEDETYKLYLFYECPNCTGAGFWTHSKAIDKKRQVGIALSRCKAKTEKAEVFKVHQQAG